MPKKKENPDLPSPKKRSNDGKPLPQYPKRNDYRKYFYPEEHWTSFDKRDLPVVRDPRKQEILIDLLENYVQREGVYTVTGFFFEHGITAESWKYWIMKCPNIATAYDEARRYLMAKRFNDGASRKATESMIKWAGQYDKETRMYVKYLAELTKPKEQTESKQDIHIHTYNYATEEEIVHDA